MNFSSKGNTYLFIFFYSFTIENMFKYQRDYNYTSSILSSFFSILDSSIHKEIFEPNRKANKQKKKGRSVSTEFVHNEEEEMVLVHRYFSMERGRDILEAAIRAKSSKGSLGIIENDRTYYCISRRGSLVTR